MPLLDHFRSPVSERLPWTSLHTGWMAELARTLNRDLPPNYLALESVRIGQGLEIDIATLESQLFQNGHSGISTLTTTQTYTPPLATATIPAVFPDTIEVKVFHNDGGLKLVAAIELISPANKDRPAERAAFVSKAASYLQAGVSLILIDVVTNRRANLHEELLNSLEAEFENGEANLYCSAYRPVLRDQQEMIDYWLFPVELGEVLPVVPLRLTGDLFIGVDLEATYTQTCRDRRLSP
jgi:hypothetical protein